MRLLTLWTLLSCRDAIAPGPSGSWLNTGQVCVTSGAGSASAFGSSEPTGAPLGTETAMTVTVLFDSCGPCTDDLVTHCEVDRAGDDIVITSDASFTLNEGTCPASCPFFTATCTLEPLPAGTYLLSHGADLATLELPADGPLCFGETSEPVMTP